MSLSFIAVGSVIAIATASHQGPNPTPAPLPKSLYDFKVPNIDGHPTKLSKYKGKVLLIVNVASLCGNTPQYARLEKIYAKYHKQGFEVLGFPENDFMNQEPGDNQQIKAFCTSTYHVTFPMFAKLDVKGPDEAPLYQWLIAHSDTPQRPIQWNFEKFLIDRNGNVVMRIDPGHLPDSKDVISMIKKTLAEKATP